MHASIVDLRYKMKDVLRALKRNETVKIFYRGKASGTLIPIRSEIEGKKIKDHPFFGMHQKTAHSVTQEMEKLRGGRYKDIDDAV